MPAIPAAISTVSQVVNGIQQRNAATKASAQEVAAIGQAQNQVTTGVADAQAGINTGVTNANATIGQGVTGANQTLADVYGQQTAALNPYLTAGAQGVNSLAQAEAPGGSLTNQFSYTPQDFQGDPQFQFLMNQGTAALGRQAAASGTAGSGGNMAALMKYGQGLASTQYGDAYNRALNTFQTNRNNTFQGLSTLAGIGQTATGQFNQAAGQYGSGVSSNTMQGGQWQAANTMSGANTVGQMGMQGTNSLANLYLQQGNAEAAGTMGRASGWATVANGISNGAQMYASGGMSGGGGSSSSGMNPYVSSYGSVSDGGIGSGPALSAAGAH